MKDLSDDLPRTELPFTETYNKIMNALQTKQSFENLCRTCMSKKQILPPLHFKWIIKSRHQPLTIASFVHLI